MTDENKTLPERLRGWAREGRAAGDEYPTTFARRDLLGSAEDDSFGAEALLFDRIADEIERTTVPLPMDGAGKLWVIGDECQLADGSLGGTVWAIVYYDDLEPLLTIQFPSGKKSNYPPSAIKRPDPPELDADGVPCEKGDIVWITPEHRDDCGQGPDILNDEAGLYGIEFGKPYALGSQPSWKKGCFYLVARSKAWCPASWLTHCEPDRLELIKNDAMHGSKWYCEKYDLAPEWDDGSPVFEYAMVEHALKRQAAIMERDGRG